MIVSDDEGWVEIDEEALEEHVRRHKAWAIRVMALNAQPGYSRAEALELIGEHELLLQEIGVHSLTSHLFDETASSLPLTDRGDYSPAGKLLAASEFMYHIGKAYLSPVVAYTLAGDLERMSEGRASQLAAQVQRAETPFGDLEDECVWCLVCQAIYLSGRDGGSWTDKIPTKRAIEPRRLRRWAEDVVPPGDREMALRIGTMAALRQERDPGQREFEDRVLKHGMVELVDRILNTLTIAGWGVGMKSRPKG